MVSSSSLLAVSCVHSGYMQCGVANLISHTDNSASRIQEFMQQHNCSFKEVTAVYKLGYTPEPAVLVAGEAVP